MKVIAINGSPRRRGNTAALLRRAIKGAAGLGADTELIHLYSLRYTGCLSCFYCKRRDKVHGVCALHDDLTPVLKKVQEADAILFGSPIYILNLTSGMQAFLERLFYSQMIYRPGMPSVFGRTMPSAFVYTMNLKAEQLRYAHLQESLAPYEKAAANTFGCHPKRLYACNTLQFDDYSRYDASMFSETEKKQYHLRQFPQDLQQAEELGRDLVLQVKERKEWE